MIRGVFPLLLASSLCGFASAAPAAEYWLSGENEVVGETETISARYEDTFVALSHQYNVGYEALRRANPGVDAWLPGEGTKIVIPNRAVLPRAPHRGIVVNVAELRLYYFPAVSGPVPEGVDPKAIKVITHPIGVGRLDWKTPLGTTTVTGKVANPTWTVPQSIRAEHAERGDILPRVVPAGPDNPLGKYALRLGLPSYMIHGTNKAVGIGMRVTHGCIRLFPEDIETMYKMVPVGTPVRIVNQPHKLGWGPGGLYLEAHLTLEQVAEAEDGLDEATPQGDAQTLPPEAQAAGEPESLLTALTRAYVAATEERRADVRWDFAEQVMQEARGVPEFVSVSPVVPASESFAADPATGR
ncbi:MAG TPA: L,D-transpeptidase family protein [Gammaproteobacteria bacterium]|nr:L,D-transpeptidase family protein [Gammaproteobacteria bacterium]